MNLSASSSETYPFDTSIFNGFRVLFNFAVVFGHVMYFLPMMLDTPELPFVMSIGREPSLSLLSACIFFLMVYAVDVFLFISGYLFALSFCFQKPNDIIFPYTLRHGVRHIINRFFRLLPVFMIAWVTGVARGSRACMNQNVLFELFYVFNFNPALRNVDAAPSVCLFGAWSLSADVQAHAFIAFSLIVLKSHKRAAQFLCFAVLFQIICRANFLYQLGRPLSQASTIVSFLPGHEALEEIASVFNLPVGNVSFSERPLDYYRHLLTDMRLYTSPYMRTAPALIGFLTWYAIDEHSAYVRFIEQNVLHTMVAICFGAATLLAGFFVVPTLGESHPWIFTLYESVHRVVFTCIVSAFVIILGSPVVLSKSRLIRSTRSMYLNETVNRISSLTYAIYLMHPFLIWIGSVMPPKITQEQFEVWRFIPSAVQVYLASVLVGIPCHVLENQFIGIRKRMTRWRTGSSEKRTIKED